MSAAATSFPHKHYAMGVKAMGAPLELIEFEVPALGEDEVLVNVAYSGMCSSDKHTSALNLPCVLN